MLKLKVCLFLNFWLIVFMNKLLKFLEGILFFHVNIFTLDRFKVKFVHNTLLYVEGTVNWSSKAFIENI